MGKEIYAKNLFWINWEDIREFIENMNNFT